MPLEATFPDQSQPSLLEFLSNSSGGGGIPIFLPIIFGPAPGTDDYPGEPRQRLVLINALTQTAVVVESGGGGSDASFDNLLPSKTGRRPASKASIDAMPTVEVASGENCGEKCAICLEEWESGETAKKMSCKHRFHGGCVERWLNISGSCPVCKYEMPEEERERRRGFWVSYGFGGDRSADG